MERDKELKKKSKLLLEIIKKELEKKEKIKKEIYDVIVDICKQAGYNVSQVEAKETIDKALKLFKLGESEIFSIATNIYQIREKINLNYNSAFNDLAEAPLKLIDEETLRLEADIERMVYKLSTNIIILKAADMLISNHTQGEDSEIYFKDSSLLKKFIDFFTPDPVLFQQIVRPQGSWFIINIPERLKQVYELIEIAEKNNDFNQINKYLD